MDQIMSGKEISNKIKDELSVKVKNCMIKPSLALIQIGEEQNSTFMIEEESKMASQIGVNFRLFQYPIDTSEREIMNRIVELNNDEYIDGIVVALPLPSTMSTKRILNCIEVSKDIVGVTNKSMARFYNNRKGFIPSVPLAVMELLKENGIELSGKNVVVVGRSNMVGKPISQLFLRKDATVTICHSKTNNLKEFTTLADILVVATGQKDLISGDMVKEGAIVVDIGITREDDMIYGDVKYDEVKKKAAFIFTPSEIMPLTTILLLQNVLECYNNKNISK